MSQSVATNLKENPIRQQYIDEVEFFGGKQLRWVQVAIPHIVADALNNNIRTNLIVLPTGTGKTISIACTLGHPRVKQALKIKNRKLVVVYLAHIHRLLSQAEETFVNDSDIDLQLHTPFSPIPDDVLSKADVIVIDEAHHEAMMSVQLQLDKMADIPIIGLTATPDRADGMVIKFENIIQLISREESVAEGWIAPTSLWSFIDTSARNKCNIIKQILTQYHEVMGKTMIFVSTRKEVAEIDKFIRQQLNKNSVGLLNQSSSEINDILNDFSKGEYDFIVNCSKIGEGVDVSGCKSVLLGKQLGSYPQLNQYIGRASRPDSDCYVFELINPLSGRNLDTTVVVGTPEVHYLCSPSANGKFSEQQFNYTSYTHTGIAEVGQHH